MRFGEKYRQRRCCTDSELRVPRLQAFGTRSFSMACTIVIPQFGNTLMELPINWILWRIEYQLVKAEIKPTAKFESGVFDGSCIDEAKLGMHTNTCHV